MRGADLRWVSWREAQGIKVYVAGLQSSRENAQLVYIPSFDVATTGCFQDTWENLKKRVEEVYKKDNPLIYEKYQVAIKFIEEQMKLDGETVEDPETAELKKKIVRLTDNKKELEARINTLNIKLASLTEELGNVKKG